MGKRTMTVKQLIDKLKEFPEDLPVATWDFIKESDIDNPNFIKVETQLSFTKIPFTYVNLE